jgi:hypothetical protein
VPGIIATIVSAISDEVVSRLATAGYPQLTDGKILLGRQHLFEQSSPPRIVMYPKRGAYRAKDPSSAAVLTLNNPYSPERLAEISQLPIFTEDLTFAVHCWGAQPNPSDPDTILDDNYDFTRTLEHTVIAAADYLMRGIVWPLDGDWTNARPNATQLDALGWEYVFGLKIATPVLQTILTFAPATVGPDIVTNIELPNGSTEVGCTDP